MEGSGVVLLWGFSRLDHVVHSLVIYRADCSQVLDAGVWRHTLCYTDRGTGVVLHPLRVGVHGLGDFNAHTHSVLSRLDARVTGLDL